MLNRGFETSVFDILPKDSFYCTLNNISFKMNLFNIIPKVENIAN